MNKKYSAFERVICEHVQWATNVMRIAGDGSRELLEKMVGEGKMKGVVLDANERMKYL